MKVMATVWRMLGRAQGVLPRLPGGPPQGHWALPVLHVGPLRPDQERRPPQCTCQIRSGESPLVGRMRDSQEEPRILSPGTWWFSPGHVFLRSAASP